MTPMRMSPKKGLMNMVLYVPLESLYISFASSVKQQCEITKSYVFWRMCTITANVLRLSLELKTAITYLA